MKIPDALDKDKSKKKGYSRSTKRDKKKVHVVCYLQIARLWWTSSWCSVYLHTSKIGGCSKIASKFPNLNVQMFGFCQYMWMSLKWLGRFRIWLPCDRNWWWTLILKIQHHFFTMYTWYALRENAKPNETIIEHYTKMFESRTSAGATEKYRCGKNLTHIQWRGPTIWKDMLKNVWNDTATNRRT